MMKSLEYLQREERFVESLLEIIDYFALRLEKNKDVPPYMIKETIDLLQVYITTSHTLREKIILDLLANNGIDAPTRECDHTHANLKQYERFFIQVIEAYDLGYQGAKWILAFYTRKYVSLLRNHLELETELLARLVDNQEQRDGEILRQFKEIDSGIRKTRERGIIRMESLKKESQLVKA
jgi:hemerythrin-like domain-containing protein